MLNINILYKEIEWDFDPFDEESFVVDWDVIRVVLTRFINKEKINLNFWYILWNKFSLFTPSEVRAT